MKYIVTIPSIAKPFVENFVRENSPEIFSANISDEVWLRKAIEMITMMGGLNPDLAQDFEVEKPSP